MDVKSPPHCRDAIFHSYVWKRILAAFALNAVTVPLVITALFVLGLVDMSPVEVMEKFKKNYYTFFKPLNQFFDFFFENALAPAIFEELVYRGPIRVIFGLLILFRKESSRWLIPIVWMIGLTLNLHWAYYVHAEHGIMWIAVFTAGIAWLWLVIETKSLWPAMVCHAIANTSIYFVIKIYQLF